MFDWNCKGELPANGNDLPPKMWTICKSRSPPWVALKGLLRRCAHSPNCAFSARSLLACLGPDWNVGRIFYGSLPVLGPDLSRCGRCLPARCSRLWGSVLAGLGYWVSPVAMGMFYAMSQAPTIGQTQVSYANKHSSEQSIERSGKSLDPANAHSRYVILSCG